MNNADRLSIKYPTQPIRALYASDRNVVLSSSGVAKTLSYVTISLICASLIGSFIIYTTPDFFLRDFVFGKFLVNKEQTIPTFYSTINLWFSAALLWVVAESKRISQQKYIKRWYSLSIIFLYLGIDELLAIHERLSAPMHQLGVNGFFHNSWTVPVFFLLLIFAAIFFPIFMDLPKTTRRMVILSAILFLGGSMVVEILGGYFAFLNGRDNLAYSLITTLEEAGEMFGVVYFIYTLLVYIRFLGIKNFRLHVKFPA
jgi:hypothetical protein